MSKLTKDGKESRQGQGGGVPSRDEMYQKIAGKANHLIDYLCDVVDGKKPASAVKMAAAKTLLNKVLPDLKATEISGNQERPLGVVILPPVKNEPGNNMATPPGSADSSPTV